MWLSCTVTVACLLSWSSSMAQSQGGDHSAGVRFAQDSRLVLPHDGWVQFVAFSNDGTLLASVSDGNDIIVWDRALTLDELDTVWAGTYAPPSGSSIIPILTAQFRRRR